MQLSVSAAAQLFRVSEETIYKWVKEEDLPATRYQDRYHFNRIKLIEWAHQNHIPLALVNGNGAPTLDQALAAGGVFDDIRGDDKSAVLRSLVNQMPLPENVNRATVLELILAREHQGTTAVGNGIAIPHVRGPIIMRLPQPSITVGFLAEPIDFAFGGPLVEVLFLLVTRTIREHTHLLARLSMALHDQDFVDLLHKRDTIEPLLECLRKLEHGAEAP